MSNVLFFVLPPLLMYLFSAYGRHVTRGVHLVWLLLVVVGCGEYKRVDCKAGRYFWVQCRV